ncbi:MAG: hypothetical protein KDD94_06400 [Calditrichaeota bacterium]|nr:hypothetical protein [Calditrichota bacterium]
MDIIKQLSSQQGERSSFPNKEVAKLCIENPHLLSEIAAHMNEKDQGMRSDCAEVFTVVAESDPQLVLPFAKQIINNFFTAKKKERWELAHALALIANQCEELIYSNLTELQQIIVSEKSIIVRDFIFLAIARYAGSSAKAAKSALNLLLKAHEIWGEKHGKQVMIGFQGVYNKLQADESNQVMIDIANQYLLAKKAVVRNEAKRFLRLIR